MTTHLAAPHSRRAFLETMGLTVAGAAAAPALAAGLPGHLPQDAARLHPWLRAVTASALASPQASGPYQPSVAALADLIERDPVVRMYVTQMIEQVPAAHQTITSRTELLATLNHIVQTAPAYNNDPSKRNTFPMSSLFVYMMYTPAGRIAFTNAAFNDAIRTILQDWCAFLDSAASRSVLNTGPQGWLSPGAAALNKLEEFVIPDKAAPHWGFASWNAYFHRQIRDDVRPLAGPNDSKVIVSANGGTWSQEYEAQVNTRGLVFVECDDPALGIVVVIPIGITEISSITIGVQAGDRVGKGDELGYFSYGGSSMCLVFEPGVIKSFSVPSPEPGSDPDGGPKIQVRSEIARAT